MTVTVGLLGRPSISIDGRPAPPPRGRKAWALLGYLLVGDRATSRARVAELLFSEANDPLAALRWSLAEIRRSVPFVFADDPIRVEIPDGGLVDVHAVLSGQWSDAVAFDGLGGEFLEGVDLAASPSFDAWLLNERRRFKAASTAVMRETVLGHLAAARTEEAVAWAVRLVAMEPLDEAYQALLVRAYVLAGDKGAALKQASACRDLLRRELGVEPGPSLENALYPSAVSGISEGMRGVSAARAQLQAGEAAIRAGAVSAGLDCLRRAALEAHSCGDVTLKLDAVAALGAALLHSGRNAQEEAGIALHETIELASRVGSPRHEAQACYELAWLEFLAARYGRAEQWLERARAAAGDDGGLMAAITWVTAKTQMETGHHDAALASFDEAVELARRAGDDFRLGFALASKARSYLQLEAWVEAAATARESITGLQQASILGLIPLPEVFLAEAILYDSDDAEEAAEVAQHAFALAGEIGDVTMLSLAERAVGVVAASQGQSDDAIEHLHRAWRRMVDSPDHTWSMAYVLDALCGVGVDAGHPDVARWVDELEALAGRSGMPEMLAHAYLHRAALGDAEAVAVAASIAETIDNPALHRRVARVAGSTSPPASVASWNSGGSKGSPRTSSP